MPARKPKGSNDVLRIQFDADKSMAEAIDWMVRSARVRTRAEVIRKSILLAKELGKQVAMGNSLEVVKPNGEREGLMVLFLEAIADGMDHPPPHTLISTKEMSLRISFAE